MRMHCSSVEVTLYTALNHSLCMLLALCIAMLVCLGHNKRLNTMSIIVLYQAHSFGPTSYKLLT